MIADISLDIIPCKLVFSTSKEDANKYLKKNHKIQENFSTPGRTLVITKGSSIHALLVLVDLDIELYDVYTLKSLVVHELSHVVTEIFNAYGFNCDETRSYMLQCLYLKCIKLVDKELENVK